MSSRVKVGSICLLSYAIGVLLSPYFLPTDFVTVNYIAPFFHEKLAKQSLAPKNEAAVLSSNNDKEGGDDEVFEPKIFKYAAPYANIIGKDDPFLNVDIVLHRNGEPDPCSRQMQTQSQQTACRRNHS